MSLVQEHRAAGRLAEAEQVLRAVVAAQPKDAGIRFALANLLKTGGRADEAAGAYQKVLEIDPHHGGAINNLGNVLKSQGQLDEAIDCYRRALRLQPQLPNALNNLGNALKLKGELPEAIDCYGQALRQDPGMVEAHFNLANALAQEQRLEEAAAAYTEVTRLRPDHAAAHKALAAVRYQQGRFAEAMDAVTRALAHAPQDAHALKLQGRCLRRLGRAEEAVATYEKAIELHRDDATAHHDLGVALSTLGRPEQAAAALRRALDMRPDYGEAYSHLAIALKQAGQLDEAVEAAQRAIELRPGQGGPWHNLALVYQEQSRLEEAAEAHRRGLSEGTYGPAAHSNMLLCLNYLASGTPEEMYEAHRAWAKLHAVATDAPPPRFLNPRDPDRRLRIGYLSPDFRAHSVNYFFEPLLGAHDRDRVEVFCYAHVRQPDHVTARVRAQADHWRDIVGIDDAEVVRRIGADQIDVLVDLAGHTSGNRLGVFSHRSAPVQVTYLGYPNTTGLKTIDYRITDDLADPPGTDDRWYTEDLIRLPGCFLCYQPPTEAPEVSLPPRQERGYVTFASFNNLAKVTPPVVQAWARILERVPGAKLMLKGKPLDDAGTRERFLARFAGHGIGPDRLDLVGWVEGNVNHLAVYEDVDIALDTFPYNGTKTTCEAMWMGVPVVTVRGDRHAGRVGASLLHHVDLDELVADDEDAYVALAADLAGRADDLAAWRNTFRQRLRGSQLCEAPSFARGFESALREMWRKWCGVETNGSD